VSNKKPNSAENCGSIFLAAAPLSFLISGAKKAMFAAIRRVSLHGLQTATFKSYRGASFRVVPRARWHAPCVMATLTGLLDDATADNESKHNNESE
jgi:hypothetical protein